MSIDHSKGSIPSTRELDSGVDSCVEERLQIDLLDDERNTFDQKQQIISAGLSVLHNSHDRARLMPDASSTCRYAGTMDNRTLRILLVDDHDVVRAGLKSVFNNAPDLEVVGEAGTSAEAIRRVGLDLPDIVILDVRLPDGSGIEACRKIKERWPATRVLILTSYADEDALIEAYDAGASGYILKRVDSTGLVDAVREVGQGEQVFGEALDAALASRVRSHGQPRNKLDRLSLQEKNVLALLAQGRSNKQIAEEMFLSDNTVKNYVSHILSKLEMASRTEAATYATNIEAERRNRYAPEDWSTD